MKLSTFLLLLAFVFLPQQSTGYYGEDTLAAHSGSWYNPDQDGHGFHVEVIDARRAIIYWYTYSPDGKPIFLLLDGKIISHGVDGPIYYYEGMKFGDFDPQDNTRQEWGSGWMEFNGCDKASFMWGSTMPGYESGSISLVRLTNIATMACDWETEGVAGEWSVWVVSSGQTEPFPTTVWNDGRFYFIDDLDCRWDGTIKRSAGGSKELVGEIGTTECPDSVPFTQMTGLYRTTAYEYCATPETCEMYAPTMQLVTEWYDTPSGQWRHHIVFTRPFDTEKTDNEVGKLAGAWQFTFGDFDTWYETDVQDDGTFVFDDSLACAWRGQLSWVDEESGLIEASLATTECGWNVPKFPLIGIYIEPYEVCGSGGVCVTYDAGMGLEGYIITYDLDGNVITGPSKLNMRFVRPLPP